MARKYYNKLIRDRIPELIERDNGTPSLSILDAPSFQKALKEKLVEEAKEVLGAESKEGFIDELGDLLEVIDTLLTNDGLSIDEVRSRQAKKRAARGGFEQKIFLSYVDKT